MKTLQERFDNKYTPEPNSGCWLWTAAIRTDGYGIMNVHGKCTAAHRVSYRLHNGLIPKGEGPHGTCVLHHCDNPICVNPDHLFLGRNKDNVDDRERKGRNITFQGEQHWKARLTASDVRAIRNDFRTCIEVGKDYGIQFAQVSAIRRRTAWSHIE